MRSRSGYAELITCGLIWGSIGVLVKEVDVSAPVIVFFRLALGAAAVGAVWAARGRLGELRLRSHRGLLVASGVVLAIHWSAFFEAYKRLPVATTILIVYVGPILIALGAPMVLGERLYRNTLYALGLSVAGIAMIAVPSVRGGDAVGFAAAGIAGVTFAVVVLILKLIADSYPAPAVVVWQLGIAAAVVSPVLVSASGREIMRAAPILLMVGVVHTGLTGLLYMSGLRRVEAQHVSILVYLEPVTAVLWAWAVLGERPAALTVVGGLAIIVAGLVIVVPGLRGISPAAMPEPMPESAVASAGEAS